jgi:hypothetical protein
MPIRSARPLALPTVTKAPPAQVPAPRKSKPKGGAKSKAASKSKQQPKSKTKGGKSSPRHNLVEAGRDDKPDFGTVTDADAAATAAAFGATTAAVAEVAPLFKQEQSNWCWAACAEMVAASTAVGLDPVPTQEQIVTSQLGTLANQIQDANQIVSLYTSGNVGVPIRCIARDGAPPQDQLDEQLQGGVPVQMGLDLGSTKHVSLVVGMDDSTGESFYIVHDPALGRGLFTFHGLQTAYGRGQWFMTFGGFAQQ